jgi:hypothetical protein
MVYNVYTSLKDWQLTGDVFQFQEAWLSKQPVGAPIHPGVQNMHQLIFPILYLITLEVSKIASVDLPYTLSYYLRSI